MSNTYERITNKENSYADEYLNDVIFNYILSQNIDGLCLVTVAELYKHLTELNKWFIRTPSQSKHFFNKLLDEVIQTKVFIKEPNNNNRNIAYPFSRVRVEDDNCGLEMVYGFKLNAWLVEHLKT